MKSNNRRLVGNRVRRTVFETITLTISSRRWAHERWVRTSPWQVNLKGLLSQRVSDRSRGLGVPENVRQYFHTSLDRNNSFFLVEMFPIIKPMSILVILEWNLYTRLDYHSHTFRVKQNLACRYESAIHNMTFKKMVMLSSVNDVGGIHFLHIRTDWLVKEGRGVTACMISMVWK